MLPLLRDRLLPEYPLLRLLREGELLRVELLRLRELPLEMPSLLLLLREELLRVLVLPREVW